MKKNKLLQLILLLSGLLYACGCAGNERHTDGTQNDWKGLSKKEAWKRLEDAKNNFLRAQAAFSQKASTLQWTGKEFSDELKGIPKNVVDRCAQLKDFFEATKKNSSVDMSDFKALVDSFESLKTTFIEGEIFKMWKNAEKAVEDARRDLNQAEKTFKIAWKKFCAKMKE